MNRFILYLTAVALAAFATGAQLVVLPWLAVNELQLPANQVGWVQSAVLFPSLLLMLVGGAVADQRQMRGLLPLMYLLMVACHGAMLWVLNRGSLELSSVLLYAASLGAVAAFIQPLRDRVLPRLIEAPSQLQASVVKVSLCVYIAQALGVTLAGQVDGLSFQVIIVIQAMTLIVCALLMLAVLRYLPGMNPDKPIAVSEQASASVSIGEGVIFVRHHPVLKHLIALVGFNGFMHIGVFVVALPLLSRDVYQQNALHFAGLQLAFVLGSVVATLMILRRGAVDQPGRAILFSLLYAGVLMLAISAKPTLVGLFLLVFAWGVVAGVSASLGKALLQQQVDDRFRGRALSIYHLALFGGAPLGALVCGYAVQHQGALALFKIGGSLTLGVFVIYLGVRALWNIAPPNEAS
ncbi:MAG: MFS transporter [Cellvibrionaceae bacterium]